GRTEHAGRRLVRLLATVEHPAALHVPGAHILRAAVGLAEAGIGVLGLHEERAVDERRFQAPGIDLRLVAAGRGGGGRHGQRWTAAAGIVRHRACVRAALVEVLVAVRGAQVQGAAAVVDRRPGAARGETDAFGARARRAAHVERADAEGVAVARAQVAHALLELAAAVDAGGAGAGTLHHQDLVGAGQLLQRAVRLEVADGELAAQHVAGDVQVADAVEVVAGGEVVLDLVVPAVGLAGQGQARTAELGGVGGGGDILVEAVGVEMDAATDRRLELPVGRS